MQDLWVVARTDGAGAGEHIEATDPGIQPVVARAAAQGLCVGPGAQDVIAEATDQGVVAIFGDESVVADAASQQVRVDFGGVWGVVMSRRISARRPGRRLLDGAYRGTEAFLKKSDHLSGGGSWSATGDIRRLHLGPTLVARGDFSTRSDLDCGKRLTLLQVQRISRTQAVARCISNSPEFVHQTIRNAGLVQRVYNRGIDGRCCRRYG